MRVRIVEDFNEIYHVESKAYWWSWWRFRALSSDHKTALNKAKRILTNDNITEVFL
jgi:hypothetical protein